MAARVAESPGTVQQCQVCDAPLRDADAQFGLLIWARGDETRYEEPPVCERCAESVRAAAYLRWFRGDVD